MTSQQFCTQNDRNYYHITFSHTEAIFFSDLYSVKRPPFGVPLYHYISYLNNCPIKSNKIGYWTPRVGHVTEYRSLKKGHLISEKKGLLVAKTMVSCIK